MPPPSLFSLADIQTYIANNPVAGLNDLALVSEIEHWQRLLEAQRHFELSKSENMLAKSERRVLRWGGLTISLAGIPACFAILPIGLAVSIAGAGITVYGEFKQWRERRRRNATMEPVQLAIDRREALISELMRRTK